METTKLYACKGNYCAYAELTGKHIAKYTLGVFALLAFSYLLISKK